MLTNFQKESLKREIKHCMRTVYWNTFFTFKLMARYLKKSVQRDRAAVLEEYEKVWDTFWENSIIFRNDKYPFTENGKIMDPMMTPYEHQKESCERTAEYIRKYNCKSILEVGSGTGLNLLHLAPMFPDVQFYGLELTQSGVEHSKRVFANPPKEFELAYKHGEIKNVHLIKGNILEDDTINELKKYKFDLVFTALVLEQLNNYLDVVFTNIFKLDFKYFQFNEQWFNFNTHVARHRHLLMFDYFRAPTELLNDFSARVIETVLPAKQPMGMNVAAVFGEKIIK